MPSLSAYRLTWVSLTLDMGYLFRAAAAKCSCCPLPGGVAPLGCAYLLSYYFLSLPAKGKIQELSI